MSLYQQDDTLFCKVLPASFNEGAILWFQKLPHGSVTSFADLLAWFAQAYVLQI